MQHKGQIAWTPCGVVWLVFLYFGRLAAAGTQERFYIYDGPAVQNFTSKLLSCHPRSQNGSVEFIPWQDTFLLAELMTEIWAHKALLEHPLRTADAEQAAYFYIPAYFELSMRLGTSCHNTTASALASGLTTELQGSPYFRRYGGSDHFTVCLSFYCHRIFDGAQRDMLSRVVAGNLEPGTFFWAAWSCHNKVVPVPYVARTDLTSEAARLPPGERNTTFFFRGSLRGRPERISLEAAAAVARDTDIEAPTRVQSPQSQLDQSYTERILRSRFCFVPRGDSPTSRRLYDAIAAGCIPIAPRMLQSQNDLPFVDAVPYEDFTIFAADSEFETYQDVTALTQRVLALPASQVQAMHAALLRWRPYLAVAAADTREATSFSDLVVSPQFGAALYDQAVKTMSDAPFACTLPPENPLDSTIMVEPEDESFVEEAQALERAQRLRQNTFPALGRPDEWFWNGETRVDSERSFLLCSVPGAGGGALEEALARGGAAWKALAPAEQSAQVLQEAYSTQWVQMVVVRDPIVRLLVTYLEQEAGNGNPGGFAGFVASLAHSEAAGLLDDQGAFRPQAGFCGLRYRSFAAELQAERLESDAPRLLQALGLGREAVAREVAAFASSTRGNGEAAAVELFRGCGWSEYFSGAVLSMAADIYAEDYARWPYYDVERWEAGLERCGKDDVGFQP